MRFLPLVLLASLITAAGCSEDGGVGDTGAAEVTWELYEPRTVNGGPPAAPELLPASADNCASYGVGDIVLSWTIAGETTERTVSCTDAPLSVELPEDTPVEYGARYPDDDELTSSGSSNRVGGALRIPVRVRPGSLLVSWSGIDCMGNPGLPATVVVTGDGEDESIIDTRCGYDEELIALRPGTYDVELIINEGGSPTYSATQAGLTVGWGQTVDVPLMPQ